MRASEGWLTRVLAVWGHAGDSLGQRLGQRLVLSRYMGPGPIDGIVHDERDARTMHG